MHFLRQACWRLGGNDNVQLLVEHPDNTSTENELALKRYLPGQIESLGSTFQVSLHRAKEAHSALYWSSKADRGDPRGVYRCAGCVRFM